MKKLGFIGGGNMAEARMRGLLEKKIFKPADLIASDVVPSRRQQLKRELKIDSTADNLEVLRGARAILLAVKPQNIDEVLGELASATDAAPATANGSSSKAARAVKLKDRLFISIAAGIPIARLAEGLGTGARVIRVMPNAPAMVGQGMAALVRGSAASKADETFALRIFRAVGDALALADEGLLDAVTALSGSGPAYVYLFVKAMADAGISEGLPAELALRM